MPLPGYEVDLVDAPPSISEFSDTGTAFWIGKATTAEFKLIHSMDQFMITFGARNPASSTYDAVETFFREGGARMWLACEAMDAVETDLIALLNNFGPDLGPGQVAAPGLTTDNLIDAIVDHVSTGVRCAVLDAPDSSTVATVTTAAGKVTGATSKGGRFSSMWWPWDQVPGIASGSDRTVPSSARVCGTIARNDYNGVPRNQPSAGPYGIAKFATGLSQDPLSDANRLTFNQAGVNVSRMIFGRVRSYGYRSLADQANDYDWSMFSNSRVIMAIKADLSVMCENFVFSMLDGQNIAVKKFQAAIASVVDPYWRRGELYGLTAGDAYLIDTGPAVNTVNTFANGELHGKVGVRTSPYAERIYIDVAKTPITQSLAA